MRLLRSSHSSSRSSLSILRAFATCWTFPAFISSRWSMHRLLKASRSFPSRPSAWAWTMRDSLQDGTAIPTGSKPWMRSSASCVHACRLLGTTSSRGRVKKPSGPSDEMTASAALAVSGGHEVQPSCHSRWSCSVSLVAIAPSSQAWWLSERSLPYADESE